MFREFWHAKRHVVEAAGIITALGALFLAIPAPEHNEKARTALASLQFIWLALITISIAVLTWNAWSFGAALEERKYELTIAFAIAGTVSWISVWVLEAMWSYMLALYPKTLFLRLLFIAYSSFYILMVGVLAIAYEKLAPRFEWNPYPYILVAIPVSCAWLLVISASLAASLLKFSWDDILTNAKSPWQLLVTVLAASAPWIAKWRGQRRRAAQERRQNLAER